MQECNDCDKTPNVEQQGPPSGLSRAATLDGPVGPLVED